jgi:hypothetical protein
VKIGDSFIRDILENGQVLHEARHSLSSAHSSK